MAREADMETAMRSSEAAPRNNEPPPECTLCQHLCFLALPLGINLVAATLLVMRNALLPRYESPEFNLTSLNATQPSALVLGDKLLVVSGWVACFSTRNPNSEPISYDRVNALLWGHCGRRFDQADVTPFKQAPAVAGQVCASFPGAAKMEMESAHDKTVWFDAVTLKANITYKNDTASLNVVCKEVKLVVSSAVATELDGGAQECTVKRKSKYPGGKDDNSPLTIALCVILFITFLVFSTVLLCGIMVPRR